MRRAKMFAVSVAVTGLLVSAAAAPKTVSEIPAPAGYARVATNPGSFAGFVQRLDLRERKQILTWEGKPIDQGFNVLAIAKLPLLYRQDLEQCADWAMRFWAEHHKAADKLSKLTLYNYDGSRKTYRDSGETFKTYLRLRMAYSNSHSLKKGTRSIVESELQPGDLIVQNETGGIGHVSVIMDAADAPAGSGKPTVFLIGFSFMPAQEFHIEKAAAEHGIDGWFSLEGFQRFLKDRLNLGEPALRRFAK